MTQEKPLVTAVIPTRNRPQLVTRAVQSALNQTYEQLELVVVIDGPDDATAAVLSTVVDPRLRVLHLAESVGGSEARNTGVRAANGEWIAFLDDDDEWLPGKIERQLGIAVASRYRFPIVASRFYAKTASGTFIWPRRLPGETEPICEYLFSRTEWARGEGQLSTIVIFARRELLLQTPFTPGLRKHQDTDWYLRVALAQGVGFHVIEEPLAICDMTASGPSITRTHDCDYSLDWLRGRVHIITPRAYAGFIATQLAPEAVTQGAWNRFLILFKELFYPGSPTAFDVALFLSQWLAPKALRHRLRNYLRSFASAKT